MKSYVLSILFGVVIGAIVTACFWWSIDLTPQAGSAFLATTCFIGVLLGWSLRALKGGK